MATQRKVYFTRASFLTIVACISFTLPAPGQGMPPPPDYLVTMRSAHDFDQTLALIKQALEAENLMVVHEINAQQMLRMVGVRVGGMRQVLFFHPRYMKQILEANRNGGIEPPLKVLVMEGPNGVMVRYEKPTHQFGDYDGLDGVAAELQAIVERVVATGTQ